MDGTGSASSFVVAVMESAGYLAHSNVLEWFDVFWRYGGSFVYLISVVGAVASVAVFGSYAWGRYLFIAPTLFWFLTNTTENIDYVTWRLGGSEPVAVDGALAQALVERDDELRKTLARVNAGDPSLQKDGREAFSENAKVSWFFSKTAKISDAVVNGLVDQILYQETNDDMLLASKASIMQFFLTAKPEDSETYQLFTEVYYDTCADYTNVLQRYSQEHFSAVRHSHVNKQIAAIESKTGTVSAEEKELLRLLRKRYGELVNESRIIESELESLGKKRHRLSSAMQEFFARMANRGEGKNKNPVNPDITYRAENLGSIMLSCKEMSDVVIHKFIEEGKHRLSDAFSKTMQQSVEEGAELKDLRYSLCQQIAAKLHPSRIESDVLIDKETGQNRECDLSQTIAIFMLRNVLLEQDVSKDLQKVKRSLMFEPEAHKVFDAVELKEGQEKVEIAREEFSGKLTEIGSRAIIDGKNIVGIRDSKGRFQRYLTQNISAASSVFYTEAQHYATREVKFDIFAGATKIPYYQGVLLYLVAVCFPFLSLLVLVPGHAQAFLNVPLTWFWLKSWDLGYACIIVMDKILWNILPATEIEDKIFTGTAGDPVNNASVIPAAIQAAMATADPTYDIHVNFNFTAMALYAVPAVTGYAILKTKKSMLASFVQGPRDAGRAAAPLSGSAYGLSIIDRNIQRLGDQAIFATWSAGSPGGNGRWQKAVNGEGGSAVTAMKGRAVGKGADWAVRAATNKLSGMGGSGGGGGKLSREQMISKGVSDLADIGKLGLKTTRSLVKDFYFSDVARARAYDKDFGTTSYMAKQHRVIGGMVDGARRFELEEMDFAQEIVNKEYEVFMRQFWIRQEANVEMYGAGIRAINELIKDECHRGAVNNLGTGAASALAAYNFYEAQSTKSSNVGIYENKEMVSEVDKLLGLGGAWKPFSSNNR